MERRLVAILAADVAGYSRLMEIDELDTLARLRSARQSLIDPKIAAYSGRLVKLMGDGALVEFPSIVDAVGCAVEIQCPQPMEPDLQSPAGCSHFDPNPEVEA